MSRKVTIRFEDRRFWIERLTAMVAHQSAKELRMHNDWLSHYEEYYNSRGPLFRLCNLSPAEMRAKKFNNPFSPAIVLNSMLRVISATYWDTYVVSERDFIWISEWTPESSLDIDDHDRQQYREQRSLSNADI